ncbi:hypothetical protein L1987_28829 [Smallanthus sonchifolius]|uniref:Uncharacterized protein n=1 Tax=Smallanthus sonchifolius TaxID=185202 RepID=A0ACB9I042_9ASTR|nr:hypothetical protein L1987_28829 [Smallanthus sonchifolius]
MKTLVNVYRQSFYMLNRKGPNLNKKVQKQAYYLSRKLERMQKLYLTASISVTKLYLTLITYLKDDDSKPLQKVFSSSAASKKTKQWSMEGVVTLL